MEEKLTGERLKSFLVKLLPSPPASPWSFALCHFVQGVPESGAESHTSISPNAPIFLWALSFSHSLGLKTLGHFKKK